MELDKAGDVANGVAATTKERNAMEVSCVVPYPYTQNMVRHSSMSAKELKAPMHATIRDSSILYIGSFGFQIPSSESLKGDIKPNIRMPPCSYNLAGEILIEVPV